jgi:hypothetical protein
LHLAYQHVPFGFALLCCGIFLALMGTLLIRNQRLRAAICAILSVVLSFKLLRRPGELSAMLIRQRWPDAWFSGLVVWYADFVAASVSIAIAVVVWRKLSSSAQVRVKVDKSL